MTILLAGYRGNQDTNILQGFKHRTTGRSRLWDMGMADDNNQQQVMRHAAMAGQLVGYNWAMDSRQSSTQTVCTGSSHSLSSHDWSTNAPVTLFPETLHQNTVIRMYKLFPSALGNLLCYHTIFNPVMILHSGEDTVGLDNILKWILPYLCNVSGWVMLGHYDGEWLLHSSHKHLVQ